MPRRSSVGHAAADVPAPFERTLTLRCAPDRLFDAIATLEGLRGWWSTDVIGSPAIGDVLRFGFTLPSHNEWIVMRVDAVRRPSRVEWTCVAQYVAPVGLEKHDEWITTRVTFDIGKAEGDGCNLRFQHHGLFQQLECYRLCVSGWDHFLRSLRMLVEEGKGNPYENQVRKS